MIKENTYLKLFANCILVNGVKRSTICDLQKEKYEFVPNSMLKIVTKLAQNSIKEVLKNHSQEDREIITEYIEYLVNNDYAFYCDKDELEFFPDINNEWDYPGQISNAIIDFDINSNHDFKELFTQLEVLGCQYLMLKSYSEFDLIYFSKILEMLKDSTISSVEIITPTLTHISKYQLTKLIEKHKRVRSIILTNAKENKQEIISNCIVEFITKKIIDSSCCGVISPEDFRVNIQAYFEAKNFNSCLNKKISIDSNGYIKNCPAIDVKYGNIATTKLQEAIYKKEFKRYWQITKDQIEVCKDCEFRYICSDCRAFLNKKELFSKPKKCNYDPYTATWN